MVLLLRDAASQGFELSSLGFTVHAFAFSAAGGFGRFTLGHSKGDTFDQRLKTIQSILFVLFLSAVLLGFNNDDPVFRNAAITQVQQSLFIKRR